MPDTGMATVQGRNLHPSLLVITDQAFAMVTPALIQMILHTNRTGMAEVVGQAVIMTAEVTHNE
jgi:hypothetical protein